MRLVSSFVIVLTNFNYVGGFNSEGVLRSASRKLTLDTQIKWPPFVKLMNLFQRGRAVVSEWLNDLADVQDELLLSSNPNADRAKSSYKKSTSATNTTKDYPKNQRDYALKDG